MNFLSSKTARVGMLYVLLCALALGLSQHERLGWCVDWRLAMLRELVQDEARAPDVLYLGSSRTVRGIRPAVATAEFETTNSPLRSGVNLGNNGTPRQMNALVLEDWLEHHAPPKVVCVEFGESDLVNWPNPLLPNIETPTDALRLVVHAPYFVRTAKDYGRMTALLKAGKADSIREMLSRRQWHMELALNALGRGPEDLVRTAFNGLANAWGARASGAAWSELFNPNWAVEPPIERRTLDQQVEQQGWYRMDPGHELLVAGRTLVEQKAAKISIEESNARRRDDAIAGNLANRADELYTERIAALCRARNIRLVFYFMPAFREPLMSTAHEQFIAGLGEVFMPGMGALQAAENYADTGHFSDLGAERYTQELARFLAR